MCESLFDAKPEYNLYHLLVRSKRPYSKCFIPEHCTNNCAEADDEEVFATKTVQEEYEESDVKRCGEQGIEEVPWEQEFAQLHVVPQDAYFDFVDKKVVST